MEILSITGGKGGTGKSTFSTLYSLKLAREGKKVVLCDTDIECPNDHLLLGAKLKKEKDLFAHYPELDESKCEKCGYCSEVCQSNAIFWTKGNYPIFMDELCSACGACWISCPYNAIKQRKQQSGEIFSSKINDNLWLITGLSNSKIAETGPIVGKTKEFAIEFAKKVNADVLIIDSAAGLHCPVISSLIGSEKSFAVTEPTPLGEHDLELILELVKKLGIKSSIVLNKSNIGNKEKTIKIAKKFGAKIEFEIPYNKEIIKAYSKGKINELEGIF